ncbi:MAG: DUF3857 domain-containing transglutaminase family protein [Rhodothermales bacterium]
MRIVRRTLPYFLLLLLAATASAQSPPYRIADVPAWVDIAPLPDPDPIPVNEISDGLYYLRLDEQDRVEGRQLDVFEHTAYAIVNTQGIQNGSQIAIEFDPTYQALTLHFVRIRRNGQTIDRLDPKSVSILQRETELEYLIFDGTLTASIILEDVQAGDIVEYAYTTSGDNPIFEGMYSSGFTTQFGIPVKEVTYRLLWPADRPLHIRSLGAQVEPQITLNGGSKEYRWRMTDVPALVVDDQLPYWYNPYPWIQLSEWESWEAVASWGLSLFDRVDKPSEALRREVDRIRDRYPSPKERMAAALRFAQDEIRYMGIEIGVNSHEPRSPAEVIQKRFGDCKDKSLLLVAMLRELGIEAHPVLVNTIDAKEMDGWLPAAGLFDHAIVRATLNDTTFWYDPTSTLQRGTADAVFQPDYDQVLVLEPGATALTRMNPPVSEEPLDDISEEFDLRQGLDRPAMYTIRSTFRGESADYMRNLFAEQSRQELERDYLNYYADLYPHIRSAGEMQLEDDETTNIVRLTERYTIDSLWTDEEGLGHRSAFFYPLEFSALLEKPASRIRTMPFGISHPVFTSQTTRVLLPEPWPIEPDEAVVDDPAFRYTHRIGYRDNVVTITHTLQTKTDAVPADGVAGYLRNVERVEENLGYELTRGGHLPDGTWAWVFGLLAGAGLLAGTLVYAARRARKRNGKG